MAEGRPGLKPLWHSLLRALALGFCAISAGCLSVSIETEVGRDGGAIRRYQYEVDPAPQGSSYKRSDWLRLADLGLDGIPGVVQIDSSWEQRSDGGTISRLTCRANDIVKLSQQDDSISLEIRRHGLWVYYRYREVYKLGPGGGDQAAAALFANKRFRHRLRLPGSLVGGNSDSLSGGWAVWNRPMFGDEGRVVMEAESRALNPLWPIAGGLLAGAALFLLWLKTRKPVAVKSFLALCLMAFLSEPSSGMGRRPGERFEPEEFSQGSIRFFAHTALFRGTPGLAWLEISYALPLDNLQFVKRDSLYQAGFTLSAIAFDRRGRQVAGDSWVRVMTQADYPSTKKQQSFSVDTVKLSLPPGRYRLRLLCSDDNSERQGIIERMLEVPDFYGRARSVGGIRFERLVDGGHQPWAQKVYGEDYGPAVVFLSLYAELADSILVRLFLDGGPNPGQTVVAETLSVDGQADVRRVIPVDSLLPGAYRLNIWAATVSDPLRPFHQSAEQLRIRAKGPSGLGAMETSLELLSYIASRQEVRDIDRAGPEARDSAVAAFWLSRDPTPGTERNEVRDDFYQRVDQANRQYSLGARPGWRTDRGRIYIKYGPPDEIERHPFEPDYRAYEIWYYYAEGVKFMFMDVHGFGDYRLMNTKAERR